MQYFCAFLEIQIQRKARTIIVNAWLYGYSFVLQTTLSARSSPKSTSRSSPPCCENGRPVMTNPLNGQTICSCQYNPATLAALYNYPRVPGLPEALYSSAVAAQAQGLLPLSPSDPPAIYPGLVSRKFDW